jgi:Holliday junction resolvase
MSANPESKLWKALRDGITDIHWVRIESWSSPGVPDVNGCAEFGEFWIELKVIKHKRVVLSPHQIAWHITRSRHSGRSYILAREAARTPLFLFSGERAKDLVDLKIDEIPMIVEIPHPYDWPRLRRALEKGRQI